MSMYSLFLSAGQFFSCSPLFVVYACTYYLDSLMTLYDNHTHLLLIDNLLVLMHTDILALYAAMIIADHLRITLVRGSRLLCRDV